MRFKGLIDGKWEYVLLPYSYYEKHYIQTKSRIGVHKETQSTIFRASNERDDEVSWVQTMLGVVSTHNSWLS